MNDNSSFYIKRDRPEEKYENAISYFSKERINQYATSKSLMRTQEKLTFRALELLELKKKNSLILDAGTGAGFVSMLLSELGYRTVALDLILGFLTYYEINYLNPIASDMCYPPFKPQIFDAIISISALQWIYKDTFNEYMKKNLEFLVKSFFRILKPHSKVIFQFYPKSKFIMDSIGKIIINHTQFKGNFIIDNPHSPKKRKIFLLLEK